MTRPRVADEEGFGLACRHCRHLFPMDVPMGVVKAHVEIEHETDRVALELVVLCPRCHQPMELEHTHGQHSYFGCNGCRRTRKITQRRLQGG